MTETRRVDAESTVKFLVLLRYPSWFLCLPTHLIAPSLNQADGQVDHTFGTPSLSWRSTGQIEDPESLRAM